MLSQHCITEDLIKSASKRMKMRYNVCPILYNAGLKDQLRLSDNRATSIAHTDRQNSHLYVHLGLVRAERVA